jgi:hypothetical protein
MIVNAYIRKSDLARDWNNQDNFHNQIFQTIVLLSVLKRKFEVIFHTKTASPAQS